MEKSEWTKDKVPSIQNADIRCLNIVDKQVETAIFFTKFD